MRKYDNIYKYLDLIAGNEFFNIKKLLTYRRPLVIVTGTRRIGKSTSAACLCALDFFINKRLFIYCRRRKRDTQETAKTFFNDIPKIINSKTTLNVPAIKYRNGKFTMGGVVCGYSTELSFEEDFKSSNLSDVYTLLFDEFISKDKNRYLGTLDTPDKEYESLISLMQTIDSGVDRPFRNELTTICLGNKSTVYNPIMLGCGVTRFVRPGVHFSAPKGKKWVWQDVVSSDIKSTQSYKSSDIYKLSTKSIQDYAYEGFSADSNAFVSPMPKLYNLYLNLRLRGKEYGVYRPLKQPDYDFIISDNPCEGRATVSIDQESHLESDLFAVSSWRSNWTLRPISNSYSRGRLRFVRPEVKEAFLDIMPYTVI